MNIPEDSSFTVLLATKEIVTFKLKIFESRSKEESDDLIQKKTNEKKIEKIMIEEERRGDLKQQVLKAFNETSETDIDGINFTSIQLMRLRGKIYVAVVSSDNYLM